MQPTSTKRASRSCPPGMSHRRGLTFLEAILAVVLLSMVAMTLSNAVSFMTNMQRRMDQKLGSAELCNRLILQYMDERDSLPNRSLPIEYDTALYRWTLEDATVKFVFDEQSLSEEDPSNVGSGVSLDRIKLITIKVWLAGDSGGSLAYSSAVPNTVITRLIDPLAFNNPDSLETLLAKPGGIEQLFEDLLNGLDTGQ